MDIFAIVNEIIMQTSNTDMPICGNACLKEDLGMDSFALTRLIVVLEERLNIEIDLSLLVYDNLETVSDICKLAERSMMQ